MRKRDGYPSGVHVEVFENRRREQAYQMIVKLLDSDSLKDMQLKQGESFRIAPGTVHYMQAVTDCDVLEASTPHLGDVVRLEDRYGREGTSAP